MISIMQTMRLKTSLFVISKNEQKLNNENYSMKIWKQRKNDWKWPPSCEHPQPHVHYKTEIIIYTIPIYR